MQRLTVKIPKNTNLFLFGDTHFGTVLCHYEGITKLINMMHSEYDGCSNNFGIHHGDVIEAIARDDPRFDDKSTSSYVLEQVDEAVSVLRPISDKLITVLQGNHELKLWAMGDFAANIAERLEVPYGTYSAHITYVDEHNNILFKHFCTHGFKSINSRAGEIRQRKANNKVMLKRLLQRKFSDTLLNSMGHTHKLILCEPTADLYLSKAANGEFQQNYTTSLLFDGDYIPDDLRWFVNTGAFLKLYAEENGISGYAERFGYDPTELGFAVAIIRDGLLQDIKAVTV